jgi:hypothetical protein
MADLRHPVWTATVNPSVAAVVLASALLCLAAIASAETPAPGTGTWIAKETQVITTAPFTIADDYSWLDITTTRSLSAPPEEDSIAAIQFVDADFARIRYSSGEQSPVLYSMVRKTTPEGAIAVMSWWDGPGRVTLQNDGTGWLMIYKIGEGGSKDRGSLFISRVLQEVEQK